MTKVVVISGGSDGLGKEIAKILSPKHKVVILSPTEEKLKAVAKELKCDYEVCNVSDYSQVEKAVDSVLAKHKRIDVLINNAALWIQGELDSNEPNYIKRIIDVNLTGVILLTKAVIPAMKTQKAGQIIIVNSQAGLYGKSERTVYTATKWGLTGFAKCLQAELPQYGIAVTSFHPGKMKTDMFKKIGIEKEMHDALDPKEAAKMVEFIVETDASTVVPEVGIKTIKN